MKKFLSSVLCLVMLLSTTIPAFAADVTTDGGAQETLVTYGMSEFFTVVIPADFDIDGATKKATADVSATNVMISHDAVLEVTISGNDYVDGWELIDTAEATNKLTYTIGSTAGGADIVNGSVVLAVAAGEAWDTTTTETMHFTVVDELTKSGAYTDTLTFTVGVSGGATGGEEIVEAAGLYSLDGTMFAAWEDTGIDNDFSNLVDVLQASYPWTSKIVIPEGITIIGENSFRGMGPLTSIVLPNSLITIEDEAFGNCINLTSVKFGNNLTTIGDDAFDGCISLTSIELPDNLVSIGKRSFTGCTSLTSVKFGNKLTTIGAYAFRNTYLTSVELPDSLVTIGEDAFINCRNLTSVKFGSNLTTIDKGAFENCASLISLDIPDSVTVIGEGAFRECTSLSSVEISNGLTTIDASMFRDCEALTSVIIPVSVTSINASAFRDCPLETVNYEGSQAQWEAISIGNYNTSLTTATINYNYSR